MKRNVLADSLYSFANILVISGSKDKFAYFKSDFSSRIGTYVVDIQSGQETFLIQYHN